MNSEVEVVDQFLAGDLNEIERKRLWAAAARILQHRSKDKSALGLALGYVQSGKTTQMIESQLMTRELISQLRP